MVVSRRNFVGGSAVLAGMSLAGRASLAGNLQERPELILRNGRLLTIDPRQPQAEAISIAGDRILAVGSNKEIEALAVPATRRVDLAGSTVVPGFIDAQVPKFVPIRLVADLDRDCLARIEGNRVRLPGIVIQLEPKREYLCNGTAAHLIGYLSEITEAELKSEHYGGYVIGEDVGKFGVESTLREVPARQAGGAAGGGQRQRAGYAGAADGIAQAREQRP